MQFILYGPVERDIPAEIDGRQGVVHVRSEWQQTGAAPPESEHTVCRTRVCVGDLADVCEVPCTGPCYGERGRRDVERVAVTFAVYRLGRREGLRIRPSV